MATATPPPVCEQNTAEEMNSEMETDECSSTENGRQAENKDVPKTELETTDTFKKPALFAIPSRAPFASSSKRSNVTAAAAASKTKGVTENNNNVKEAKEPDSTKGEESSAPVNENKTTEEEGQEEQDIKVEAVQKNVAPVKTQADAKPRVLPPIGKFPPVPYTEPPWGGQAPETPYALEILKNGAIVDQVPLTQKSYFVVGRLPVCDVSLEHPSISRYHAVVQYRGSAGDSECVGEERGFYVHDLGSTHGTVVNKNKIPPKTFIRLRVGHVLKFGGSTRLFILQGPEFDEEEESELGVTELREKARKHKEELEKRMMGDGGSDDDEEEEEKDKEGGDGEGQSNRSKGKDDSGCSWGIAEEAAPEEDENEENPFSTEFQEDQEAAYLKDPKKALQGFYDREGEELEFEYEDKSHGSWMCRIKLPVDDAKGKQLVAEVTVVGKKKEALIQCCLEACRMLEARGLLRQEAVSRKRRKKNWEDEDFYDSDDDTFLDRTGTVEKKRQDRMKKLGKIEERPDTYETLVSKLSSVEKELTDTQKKLSAGRGDSSSSSSEDPLDAFMTAVRSEAAMDAVERRKLHVHTADLRKEVERLRRLVELTRPAQLPSLMPSGSSETEKPKKTLPLFGAMKGGSKFKLKTGTIGKLPPKRANLPAELFNMRDPPPSGEEEEEEEEKEKESESATEMNDDSDEESSPSMCTESAPSGRQHAQSKKTKEQSPQQSRDQGSAEAVEQLPQRSSNKAVEESSPESKSEGDKEPAAQPGPKKNVKKKVMGPSRPPVQLTKQYPEDDPDYCVWMPPTGQSGDGKTHLNEKYGY